MKIHNLYFAVLAVLALTSCKQKEENMSIHNSFFGNMPGGKTAELFSLTNRHGMTVKITNYGGIITSIIIPDKAGKMSDVALGFDQFDGYLQQPPYLGAIIGRYGNRIARGKFSLDGAEYTLAANNGLNHLHGGIIGFDKVLWRASELHEKEKIGLQLQYLSKDGEEGYPGNLTVSVTYWLSDANEILIDYMATTDKKTIINLTNHSYFNLKDGGETPITGHRLLINANAFTPIDSTLIPTGEIRPVQGSPFDFTSGRLVGEYINAADEQIRFGQGYDHNFVLNNWNGQLRQVAEVFEEQTGRVLQVFTTEPGLQFYSGNFLDGSITGKNGIVYQKRHGFCLETQHFPDSPNKPHFPTAVLQPGETYRSSTIYKFSVRK
jgi:aldose 1-epimerase